MIRRLPDLHFGIATAAALLEFVLILVISLIAVTAIAPQMVVLSRREMRKGRKSAMAVIDRIQ